MKNLFAFLALIFFAHIGSGQCPTSDLVFPSQSSINRFAAQYPSCSEIPVNIRIVNNSTSDPITSLDGLSQIRSISGNLSISGLTGVANLSGLNNLRNLEGNLGIQSNPSLISLTGLEGLTNLWGYLTISSSPLANLTGLDNITNIDGHLMITRMPSLTDLSALTNITAIGGQLDISFNDQLTSLNGLENIHATSILNLTLAGNPQLSNCEVQSICNYIGLPNKSTVGIRSNNATGCNSKAEVAAACAAPPAPPTLTWGADNFAGVIAKVRHTGKVLDLKMATGEIIQYAEHGGDNQLWNFELVNGVYYKIISKKTGRVMDLNVGTGQVTQYQYHGGDNQLWKVEPCMTAGVPDNQYKIISKKNSKVLQIAVNGKAVVEHWDCSGNSSYQQFTLMTADTSEPLSSSGN